MMELPFNAIPDGFNSTIGLCPFMFHGYIFYVALDTLVVFISYYDKLKQTHFKIHYLYLVKLNVIHFYAF